jgi:hypothetical protein
VKRHETFAKGDQYVYTALAATQKAIISYRIGKRDGPIPMSSSRTFASAFWAP